MPKVWEKIENNIEEEDDIVINELLEAELGDNGELFLHVEDVRNFSLSEKLEMLRTGLQKLAYMLETDPELKDVQKISGTSWIVYQHPKLMKNLGFEVITDPTLFPSYKTEYENRKEYIEPEFKDLKPAYAYISRDKFLQLHNYRQKAA